MNNITDRYTYRVIWSAKDNEYVGLCTEFPSVSWLEPSREKAFAGIIDIVRSVVEDMERNGEKIPEPICTHDYSGKFMVRIPPDVHRDLAIEAAEAGVSLNRLVSARLARGTSGEKT